MTLAELSAKTGVWVRMSKALKLKLHKHSRSHLREFHDCVGRVGDHLRGPRGERWPEVEVYWQMGDGLELHYGYLPEDLEVVEL